MIVSEIELFETLAEQLGKDKAKSVLAYVDYKLMKGIDEKKDLFASKQDIAQLEIRLNRSMYIIGLAQFLAIVSSVIAIYKLVN